jgi:cell division protease FtsH
MDGLHTVANALLEYETLSGEDIEALLKGEPVVRASDTEPPKTGGRKSSVPPSGEAGKGAPDISPNPQPET